MPMPGEFTQDTTGYFTEQLREPYRWIGIEPKVQCTEMQPLGSEEIAEITHTDILVEKTNHRRLGLQLPPNYHRNPPFPSLIPSPKEDLAHKTRIADEMLRTYFEKGEGRGLNIRKPRTSYFDMASIKRDTFSDKIFLNNHRDFFSSFKKEYEHRKVNREGGDYASRLTWDDTPYRPRQESFIRSMEYDPDRGRIDIDLETCHYTYSDIPFRVNPADPLAYVNLIEEKDRIRNNLTIIIKSRANPIFGVPKNELKAIETLREMITEREFRKYMKHGFILVRGRSGRIYQIFRDKDHTKVWEKGRVVEEVCVRLKRSTNVPPTDNVIAFRTLVLCSENEFKKLGNVYKMAA